MGSVGLTHGGFYAHFPTRDALVAESIDRAGLQSLEAVRRGVAKRIEGGAAPAEALVETYLSDAHLAGVETGCPVAALIGEAGRQAPEIRDATERRLCRFVELVGEHLPAGSSRNEARSIAATLIGSLQMARAISDPAQARATLATHRRMLLSRLESAALR